LRIPNAERAIVDIEKLRCYCLNFDHPRGKHKALLFSAALGLTSDDAEELQRTLLNVVRPHDAIIAEQDQYGKRYMVDFTMARGAYQARIRSSWITRMGEHFPRLTSCYVLKKGDLN
jgi:hypothetical protein